MATAAPSGAISFQVLAEIATGATSRIDLCRAVGPPRDGQLLAVKRLHAHIADDPAFAHPFFDEIWMTAALRHPNVVEVAGWGRDAQGAYLAVELVQGVSLARLMKTVFETGEEFSERMVVFIGSRLCRGLAAAHALRSPQGELLQLVHRDLTPGNVLTSFQGDVKITDFGLAKAKQRITQTAVGMLKGQPAYMAPEQALGHEIDSRADLFSLGVVLFELFAGQRPWTAATEIDALKLSLTAPPADLSALRPKLHSELAGIVLGCLQKDRRMRFQSAEEIQQKLDTWLDLHGYLQDNEEALGRFVRRNAMRQMRWFERAIAGQATGTPESMRQSVRLPLASLSDVPMTGIPMPQQAGGDGSDALPPAKPDAAAHAPVTARSSAPTVPDRPAPPRAARTPAPARPTPALGTRVPVPAAGTRVPVPAAGTRVPVPAAGTRVPVPAAGTRVPVPAAGTHTPASAPTLTSPIRAPASALPPASATRTSASPQAPAAPTRVPASAPPPAPAAASPGGTHESARPPATNAGAPAQPPPATAPRAAEAAVSAPGAVDVRDLPRELPDIDWGEDIPTLVQRDLPRPERQAAAQPQPTETPLDIDAGELIDEDSEEQPTLVERHGGTTRQALLQAALAEAAEPAPNAVAHAPAPSITEPALRAHAERLATEAAGLNEQAREAAALAERTAARARRMSEAAAKAAQAVQIAPTAGLAEAERILAEALALEHAVKGSGEAGPAGSSQPPALAPPPAGLSSSTAPPPAAFAPLKPDDDGAADAFRSRLNPTLFGLPRTTAVALIAGAVLLVLLVLLLRG